MELRERKPKKSQAADVDIPIRNLTPFASLRHVPLQRLGFKVLAEGLTVGAWLLGVG